MLLQLKRVGVFKFVSLQTTFKKTKNNYNNEKTTIYRSIGDDCFFGICQNFQKGDYGYLYCHMSDRGQWTAYAISRDGYNYEDLIDGDPIMDPKVHARIEGGQRDAYICRSWDGKGYVMVTTDMNNSMTKALGKQSDWDNYGIDLLRSDDLIHWKSVSFDYRKGLQIFSDYWHEGVYRDWSTINRVWAPQIFWDPDYIWDNGDQGGYMIYYSMLNRPEEKYDRMYYSHADKTFTKLTQPRLLFDWGYATIDADINLLPDGYLSHAYQEGRWEARHLYSYIEASYRWLGRTR